MNDLIFSINVVLPLFMIMLAGFALKKINIVGEKAAGQVNKIVFRLLLPCYMISSISKMDLAENFNVSFMAFTLLLVLAVIGLCFLVFPLLVKGNRQRSVLVQAVFRSNFLLYGLPVAERISGAEGAGVVSMLLAMIIPLFNFFAVFTLEFFSDKNGKGKKFNMKPIFLEILKNPLIIAAAAGILLALFKVKLPVFLSAPIGDLAKCATPIALLSLGMQFDFKKVNTNKTYLMMGTAGRLIVVPALALAAAVFRGIGGAELTALLSLFASPAAVTSYIMAHEAGADSDLAGQLVVATTIFSSVTVFCFVFVLHSLSLI